MKRIILHTTDEVHMGEKVKHRVNVDHISDYYAVGAVTVVSMTGQILKLYARETPSEIDALIDEADAYALREYETATRSAMGSCG